MAVLLCVTSMHADTFGLLVVWGFLVIAFRASLIPISRIARDLRPFLILSLVIFIVTLWSSGRTSAGEEFRLLLIVPAALLVVWRFLSMVLIGVLLTATTDPTGIQHTAYWFTRHIPGIPSHRVATMVMLTIRFVPLILDEASEIQKACRSRHLDARRNRISRITAMGTPLISSLLRRGDETALAMVSRGYAEDRIPQIRSSPAANLICFFTTLPTILLGLFL